MTATRAFVVMTALPPTRGHLEMVRFAKSLAGTVTVMVNTQPDEPYAFARAEALREGMRRIGCTFGPGADDLRHLHCTLPQDPDSHGFWPMWRRLMDEAGCHRPRLPGEPECSVVASEPYGQRLADLVGVTFMPYDLERSVTPIKATPVRDHPYRRFAEMIPEFQRLMRLRVTIFGAESTGKTTLAADLARASSSRVAPTRWLFEWARPYLEATAADITVETMTAIWQGQAALQRQVDVLDDTAIVVQDTDLYSTLGYWQLPHWTPALGPPPDGLRQDARTLASDLYLMTRANIPFEEDPLRYGGDRREGSDEYWEAVLAEHGLPYVVLDSTDRRDREIEALGHLEELVARRAATLAYDRGGF